MTLMFKADALPRFVARYPAFESSFVVTVIVAVATGACTERPSPQSDAARVIDESPEQRPDQGPDQGPDQERGTKTAAEVHDARTE